MASEYKFSFGPWNISEGNDPFGPAVRPTVAWGEKLRVFKRLGDYQRHAAAATSSMEGFVTPRGGKPRSET